MTVFLAPQPLADHHRLDDFRCGVESLDEWLVKRARANGVSGASRTFVVVDDADVVVGYYSLSTGSVLRRSVPRALRHGAPDPVPVLLIGRFAVSVDHQGEGLGRSMLQDALLRCARQSAQIGFMAVLVHPVDDDAERFWRRFGFVSARTEEPMLMLALTDVLAVAEMLR